MKELIGYHSHWPDIGRFTLWKAEQNFRSSIEQTAFILFSTLCKLTSYYYLNTFLSWNHHLRRFETEKFTGDFDKLDTKTEQFADEFYLEVWSPPVLSKDELIEGWW